MRKLIDNPALITKCCILHYEENLSQSVISKMLKVSPASVCRMLKEGRDTGIVYISVNRNALISRGKFKEEEEVIKSFFSLLKVSIVSKGVRQNETLQNLGVAASDYLNDIIKDGYTIGVSLGTSVKSVAQFLKQKAENVKVASLVGGIGQIEARLHPNQIVMDYAEHLNAAPVLLNAPAVVNDNLRHMLMNEKEISDAVKTAENSDIIVFGIGNPSSKFSTMKMIGYFDENSKNEIMEKNAVADICLRLLDKNGDASSFSFNKKIFGVDLNKLKTLKYKVAIAGGEEKTEAIIAAIHGGYVNSLITTQDAAREIIDYINKMKGTSKN